MVKVDVIVDCCQHSLFAHQTVRTASVLRLTSAAQAGEAFGFVVIVIYVIFFRIFCSRKAAGKAIAMVMKNVGQYPR